MNEEARITCSQAFTLSDVHKHEPHSYSWMMRAGLNAMGFLQHAIGLTGANLAILAQGTLSQQLRALTPPKVSKESWHSLGWRPT